MKKPKLMATLATFVFLGTQLSQAWGSNLRPNPYSFSAANGKSINVTGYGASRASWDAHHKADLRPNIVPGSSYNHFQDPKRGGGFDRYSLVQWSDGVITGYDMSLPSGTKLKEAMLQTLLELPKDFKISFFYANALSGTLEVTLKKILSRPKIGSKSGAVDFVFCSVSNDGTTSYDKNNINDVSAQFGMGLSNAKGWSC